jgi:hypothetical protein
LLDCAGPAGSIETARLCDCRWLLALGCRWVSGVYEAGLWDSRSESARAGGSSSPSVCGTVSGGAVCVGALAVAAAASSTAWRTLGSLQLAAAR